MSESPRSITGPDLVGDGPWASLARAVLDETDPLPTLDIGCGLGEWLAQYRAWFPHRLLVGIDVSRERIKEAAARSGPPSRRVRLVVAAAERLPFRTGTFGAVTCKVVSSYVWLQPTLREMRRVMRNCGVAAVQTHSALHYWELAVRGVRIRRPRLIAYAAWVAVNTALLYVAGAQSRLTNLGRSGAPHTFLPLPLWRRLLRTADFQGPEYWPGAPRGEPAFVVRAGEPAVNR